MGEQHYGRAPCGCYRVDGVLAASVIEQFVRACAWEGPDYADFEPAPSDGVWPFRSGFAFDGWAYRFACGEWVWHVLVSDKLLRACGRKPESVTPAEAKMAGYADAIEQGLRAIAGWPAARIGRGEYAVTFASPPKWEDVAPLISELLASYTHKIGVPPDVAREVLAEVVGHPDEFANCDCPSHAGEDGEVVVRPSARTTCYFCGRAVADGVCTVCGERQPTTEREDT